MDPLNVPATPAAPSPESSKQFEELIQSWERATTNEKPEEAMQAAMQALALAAEQALENPTPDIKLKEEAALLEEKGAWQEAESVRRQIISLEQETGNYALIANAQMELSRLLRTMGRADEAAASAADAVASARRADMFTILAMALEAQAFCALNCGDTSLGLASASEAVNIIEAKRIFDPMRGKAMTTRARCYLAANDLEAASRDLAEAGDLISLNADNQYLLPGVMLRRAQWYEVNGSLKLKRGELCEARRSLERSLSYWRSLDSPHLKSTVARLEECLKDIERKQAS